MKSRGRSVYPLPQCTKTGKLLRLLEASHREDRRRLHEDDECCEEDIGDRWRDASVRDIVPKADAVRDALRVVVALVDEAANNYKLHVKLVGPGRVESGREGARPDLGATTASMAPPDDRVRCRSLRYIPRARAPARFRECRRAGGVLGGSRGMRRLRADV